MKITHCPRCKNALLFDEIWTDWFCQSCPLIDYRRWCVWDDDGKSYDMATDLFTINHSVDLFSKKELTKIYRSSLNDYAEEALLFTLTNSHDMKDLYLQSNDYINELIKKLIIFS
jgi:hypothetical protein